MVEVIHSAFGARPAVDPPSAAIAETVETLASAFDVAWTEFAHNDSAATDEALGLFAREVLARYWGYDTFRPLQQDAMRAILDSRDSIVVLPTGGGKSL